MTPRAPTRKAPAGSAKKVPAAKAAATRAPARKPAAKRPAKKAAPAPSPYGPVETATRAELDRLHMTDSALAQSAILMAHMADGADTAAAAAQAARELRMTMSNVRGLVGQLFAGEEEDGSVVPPSRLENLRKKAASRGRSAK